MEARQLRHSYSFPPRRRLHIQARRLVLLLLVLRTDYWIVQKWILVVFQILFLACYQRVYFHLQICFDLALEHFQKGLWHQLAIHQIMKLLVTHHQIFFMQIYFRLLFAAYRLRTVDLLLLAFSLPQRVSQLDFSYRRTLSLMAFILLQKVTRSLQVFIPRQTAILLLQVFAPNLQFHQKEILLVFVMHCLLRIETFTQ